MSYKEICAHTNEEYWERLELVMERIVSISEEGAASVEERYRGYYVEMAELLQVMYRVTEAAVSGKLETMTKEWGERLNRRMNYRVIGRDKSKVTLKN